MSNSTSQKKPETGDVESPYQSLSPEAAELLAREIANELAPVLAARLEEHIEQSNDDDLLDIEEVAEYLQVSKRTVETLVAEGEIKPIWVRGQRRFTKNAIQSYLWHNVG